MQGYGVWPTVSFCILSDINAWSIIHTKFTLRVVIEC